jgi:hypothetical protein
MPEEFKIKIGSSVKWTSQVAGNYTEKEGIVRAYLPSRSGGAAVLQFFKTYYVGDITDKKLQKLMKNFQGNSVYDRYLVEVSRINKRTGAILESAWYAPNKGVIESQNNV